MAKEKVFVLLTDDLLDAHPEIAGEQLLPWKQDTACFYAEEKQRDRSENSAVKRRHDRSKKEKISEKPRPEKNPNTRPAAVGTYLYA